MGETGAKDGKARKGIFEAGLNQEPARRAKVQTTLNVDLSSDEREQLSKNQKDQIAQLESQ